MSGRGIRRSPWALLFLRSVLHTRVSQLVRRVTLSARRRARLALDGLLPNPGWWNDPPPAIATTAARTIARLGLLEAMGSAQLPLKVRIAGREVVVEHRTDWRLAAGSESTPLQRLSVHYHEWLTLLDAESGWAVIRDWLRANPRNGPNHWMDSWNCYGLSLRVVEWMRFLLMHSSGMSDARRRAVTIAIAQHVRFLERNLETDIGGNHLIRNIRALAFASVLFEGSEAKRWAQLAGRLLRSELDEQVLADGMHFELSPSYHTQVFVDLLECHVLLVDDGVRAALAERLRRMATVVADLRHPDGTVCLLNDAGLNMGVSAVVALDAYERQFGPRPGPRQSFALRNAGYFGWRNGGDFIVVDCGFIGPDHLPAHAHGDVLSFEWSVGGTRFVVDAGVGEYEAGPLRELSRATKSHNTVTLDGLDQAEFWSSFRVGRRPKVSLDSWRADFDEFCLAGSHTGYCHLAGSPIHRRAIRGSRDGLQIDDEVCGGKGQLAVARILLAPGVLVSLSEDGATLQAAETTVRLVTSAPVIVQDALFMPDIGDVRSTSQLLVEYGPAPCRGSFALDVVRRQGAS